MVKRTRPRPAQLPPFFIGNAHNPEALELLELWGFPAPQTAVVETYERSLRFPLLWEGAPPVLPLVDETCKFLVGWDGREVYVPNPCGALEKFLPGARNATGLFPATATTCWLLEQEESGQVTTSDRISHTMGPFSSHKFSGDVLEM